MARHRDHASNALAQRDIESTVKRLEALGGAANAF